MADGDNQHVYAGHYGGRVYGYWLRHGAFHFQSNGSEGYWWRVRMRALGGKSGFVTAIVEFMAPDTAEPVRREAYDRVDELINASGAARLVNRTIEKWESDDDQCNTSTGKQSK